MSASCVLCGKDKALESHRYWYSRYGEKPSNATAEICSYCRLNAQSYLPLFVISLLLIATLTVGALWLMLNWVPAKDYDPGRDIDYYTTSVSSPGGFPMSTTTSSDSPGQRLLFVQMLRGAVTILPALAAVIWLALAALKTYRAIPLAVTAAILEHYGVSAHSYGNGYVVGAPELSPAQRLPPAPPSAGPQPALSPSIPKAMRQRRSGREVWNDLTRWDIDWSWLWIGPALLLMVIVIGNMVFQVALAIWHEILKTHWLG
jgi:hypothetical protein